MLPSLSHKYCLATSLVLHLKLWKGFCQKWQISIDDISTGAGKIYSSVNITRNTNIRLSFHTTAKPCGTIPKTNPFIGKSNQFKFETSTLSFQKAMKLLPTLFWEVCRSIVKRQQSRVQYLQEFIKKSKWFLYGFITYNSNFSNGINPGLSVRSEDRQNQLGCHSISIGCTNTDRQNFEFADQWSKVKKDHAIVYTFRLIFKRSFLHTYETRDVYESDASIATWTASFDISNLPMILTLDRPELKAIKF